MKLCGLAILAAPALLAGCGLGSKPLAPAGHPAPSGETESLFRGTSVGKRPAILTLARDGDPFPALAVAVRVAAGPRAAEGLAALIDARLSEAGVAADTRVARDGFHVRILLREASAERVVAALRDALLATVTDGPELRLAAARVLALRALVVDDDALSPIVACSQELRLTSLEAKVEGLTVTAASLEIARAAAVGDQTVAVGVVGPRDAVERVRAALASQPEWPSAAAAPRDWPNARSEGAYLLRERGGSRISVALRVPLRSAALGVAQRAVDPSSPLVARLRALPVPFLVRRVVATVHGSGACITVDAESELRAGTALTDATTAAAAALVVEHELLAELAEKTEDGTAAAQIRALADPREAAAAAANWALSQDATTQPTIPAFALGIPPRSGRDDPAAIAAAFSSSLAAGERAWARSAVDNRVAVEADQGQFWLLLASPCPLREGVPQAGLTTLTLEALTFSGVRHGVSVEPWIASDGFGLLAHAARLPGESGDALATRVADAAARLLDRKSVV